MKQCLPEICRILKQHGLLEVKQTNVKHFQLGETLHGFSPCHFGFISELIYEFSRDEYFRVSDLVLAVHYFVKKTGFSMTTQGLSPLSVFFSRLKYIPKTYVIRKRASAHGYHIDNTASLRELDKFILSCGVNVEQKILTYVDDELETFSQLFCIPDACLSLARAGTHCILIIVTNIKYKTCYELAHKSLNAASFKINL
jgi:hypothetical protein